MKAIVGSKTLRWVLAGGMCFAGLIWWQRGPLLAWYHVRQLSQAYQDDRSVFASRVAALEEAALPLLIDGLHDSDAIVCDNMRAALELMLQQWGPADSRCQNAIVQLREQFDTFSPAGQEKTLLMLTAFLQHASVKPCPPPVTHPIGELMLAAEKKDELRGIALLLASELLDCVEPGQWCGAVRQLIERGIKEPVASTRIAAVRLLLRQSMRSEKDLLAKVVPLLQDKEFQVRRVAILALSTESELVREDTLMPLLHDDDAEVQYLCELTLRQRGLSDNEIQLARLISDKDPAIRMHVLVRLPLMPDLNMMEWLRQLSVDPSAAVRMGAIRAASEIPSVDFSRRLREMAEQDPSEAVRLNARYYLSWRLAQTKALR